MGRAYQAPVASTQRISLHPRSPSAMEVTQVWRSGQVGVAARVAR